MLYDVVYSGWPKFPKDHFQGELNCYHLRNVYSFFEEPGPFEGNTSHPILLVGNTAGKQASLSQLLFRLSDRGISRPCDTALGVGVIFDVGRRFSKLTNLQRKENGSRFPRFGGPNAGFRRSELKLQQCLFSFDIDMYLI
jgi:hypothetical protein